MTRDEILTIYESAIARAGLERKGKTMPYTSSNGYMFSQLNKDLEIGIRLSKADTEEFDKEFGPLCPTGQRCGNTFYSQKSC